MIRNASVRMLEPGVFMRLTVNGKWGKVSEHPDGVRSTPAPPKTVNHDNNKSSGTRRQGGRPGGLHRA